MCASENNVRGAVPAGPVQFAKSLHTVRVDFDRAATVMLDDLVAGRFGATSDDIRGSGGLFDGNGVLADVFKPNIV